MHEKPSCEAFEWCESIVFALLVTITVLVFGVNFSRVSGHSMDSTLADGDHVLVQTLFYKPKRGDVITTDAWISYAKPLAKRVIATEGDTVLIDSITGTVSINGQVLQEPYLDAGTVTLPGDVAYPLTVPQGKLFVMGDNRSGSLDSRASEVGFIDKRDILGKVLLRIAPFGSAGKIK